MYVLNYQGGGRGRSGEAAIGAGGVAGHGRADRWRPGVRRGASPWDDRKAHLLECKFWFRSPPHTFII